MESAIQSAARLVNPGGWLGPLTTASNLPALQAAVAPGSSESAPGSPGPPSEFIWSTPTPLPGSDQRILALARRSP
jgi:hypothetical protein